MNEIKCPHCGQAFTVNESEYAELLNQVRSDAINAEVDKQMKVLKESSLKETELALNKAKAEKDEEINALNIRLQQAKSDMEQKNIEHDMAMQKAVADKDSEIVRLNQQLESLREASVITTENEVTKALTEKNSEINTLKMKIQKLESEAQQNDSLKELAVTQAVNEEKQRYEQKLSEKNEELSKKNEELIHLNSDLKNSQLENRLKLTEETNRLRLENEAQKAEYEAKLKAQQESLEYYKDLKTKMSTKMIGETLEQHCENSFNMLRATAFRNVEFGKDNDVRDGSKGDYIYREKDPDGNELISIMFEMKNEMDTTATKHKNEDFFAKLDKDRKNKNCEYAVLVSMLESESELYNQGIVDVSYDYEKMYVIRPQFFIPMITILRNAAMNSMEYKRQLTAIKNQEIDITHFEERIESFKSAFSKNYELAGRQFNTAIEEIDKTIDHLKKVKDNLQKSLNNLRLANDKAQNQLTIKALAKDNPTMINMFSELDSEENE